MEMKIWSIFRDGVETRSGNYILIKIIKFIAERNDLFIQRIQKLFNLVLKYNY